LIRLVPEDTADAELLAIKRLLNHRLKDSYREAREEWLELVEGTHELWKGVRFLTPSHLQPAHHGSLGFVDTQ
jgi:hypothetical protein